VIVVPHLRELPGMRLYQDSGEAALVYVDLLEAAPMHGAHPVWWLDSHPGRAYLLGEVRFGPGADGFGELPGGHPGRRLLPMPWEQAPVHAWGRAGDGVRLLAEGTTSGFGAANAILNGTAPAEAVAEPVVVAAELTCRARLAGASVRGSGAAAAFGEAAAAAPMGPGTAWSATLADGLLPALRRQVARGRLALTVEAPSTKAADALAELAMLEWAARMAAAAAPPRSLAGPAAAARRGDLPGPPDPRLEWRPGDLVPLRALRRLVAPARPFPGRP
jgi:hypothetical protein